VRPVTVIGDSPHGRKPIPGRSIAAPPWLEASGQFEQTTNERMLKCYAKGMEELLVTLRSDPSALITQQRREPRIAGREGQRHETPPSRLRH